MAKKAARKASAPAAKKASASGASPDSASRTNWLDEATQSPLIDDYARELGTFLDALSDGRVDTGELKAQEARLVALMKEVEPNLDDALHEQVTRLLCEVSAYSIMQALHELHAARARTMLNL